MSKNSLWLPSIFSSNMMLQANRVNFIWGKCKPGRKIVIKIGGKTVSGNAGKNGEFKINLPVFNYGGPFNMIIDAGEKRVIKNILVGDIWIASGQSNMEWMLKDVNNSVTEIKTAKYPDIRVFNVNKYASFTKCNDVSGRWDQVLPHSVENFSAVAYFFGRELYKELNKPIGLINSSWGGTRIEWWMSDEALKKYSDYEKMKILINTGISKLKKRKKTNPTNQTVSSDLHVDTGNEGSSLGYSSFNYDSSNWKTLKAPGYWNGQGLEHVGSVWFRKEINIPEIWKDFDLALELGPIVDFDDTYFNGEKVGSIKIDVNNFWAVSRRYLIPRRFVLPGKNTLAVRIFAHNKVGGFGGNKENMNISVINMEKKGKINISGNWKYRVEKKLPPVSQGTGGESILPENLYNGMLYPLVGFGIKGFIWYQGESNADSPKEYLKLSKLFIGDLRQKWNDPELPFYFVQIANYFLVEGLSDWPALRDAQLKTLKLPNTGMAVTIDIGTSNDIHPKNKQDVGKRLALNALAKTYGKKIEYSGPVYKRMDTENGKLRLYFEHSKGLCALGGKELLGFEIAGKNGRYFQAKAKIDKGTVLLSCGKVKQPVSARYAWANDPICNLYNSAKLPASPFKTEAV